MKTLISLFLVFIVLIGFSACANNSAADQPASADLETSQASEATVEPHAASDLAGNEVVYLDGMSAEEISQQIRGKVFQADGWDVGAGLSEIYYFAPEGNEYYWFSSSYNAQERIIAEYGVWEFEDDVLTFTTQRYLEAVGGHYAEAWGGITSKYALEDYDVILTEASIASQDNFRLFQYNASLYSDESKIELGFRYRNSYYYHAPNIGGIERLRITYDYMFALIDKTHTPSAIDSEKSPITINPELITEQNKVGDWIYFLHPHPDTAVEEETIYTLYRQREDGSELTQLANACDTYSVVDDCVYFASYILAPGNMHGLLYRIDPGHEPRELADEVHFFQIVDGTIYYTLDIDTMGAGIEGHALHRIDLDGGNHIIAAYEVVGPDLESEWHVGSIEDGYVYYKNYAVKLGDPADGMEEVRLLTPTDSEDGWIYYATNRLFKAKSDGSEQVVLDGNAESWIQIDQVEGEWIYYTDYSISMGSYASEYKIRKDGTGRTEI